MIEYEWDVEEVFYHGDGECDVVDHNHHDNPVEMIEDYLDRDPGTSRMVLVRDVLDDFEGLLDRYWAYIDLNTMSLPVVAVDSCGSEVRISNRMIGEFKRAAERFAAELEKAKKVAE